MFDPPAGFADLIADADDAPHGSFADLDVPDIGVLHARHPKPRSAAALAMSANRRIPAMLRQGYVSLFVIEHLEPGRFDELLADMLTGQLPEDAVTTISRRIATWGTARPYSAVVTLTSWTGFHWRTIRSHLVDKGIAAPLSALPNLHALLDVTENLVLQAASDGKPADAQRKRREIIDALYRPEPGTLSPAGTQVQPFDDADMEDSFDQFRQRLA